MKKVEKKRHKNLKDFIKGIYAGIFIGIGGVCFLAIPNKMVGSFIFSIGLLSVCIYGANLFTGKIGYIITNKLSYIKELALSLLGNFVGASLVGLVMRLTRNTSYIETAKNICNIKLNDTWYSILILSIFCGMLMYIAVNNYKKEENGIGKYAGIFMCVMAFILCGFEHCVANMFYFAIAFKYSFKVFLYLIIMILGNSIGSVIISLFDNIFKNIKE